VPKFVDIEPISQNYLEEMGFSWHKDGDGEYIVRDRLIELSIEEVKAYEEAVNKIYEMYEKAAEYVIEYNLFDSLDIPPSLIEHIRYSWENERDNHLYGRFDLSGGIDGAAIKLIEFNADTPTLLLESAVIQYMMLEFNSSLNANQFNTIYEKISHKFLKIAKGNKGLFSKFLFSSVEGIEEERVTVELLQNMAKDASLVTSFAYLEECEEEVNFDIWFKLYPWEDMPNFQASKNTSMLNPAYTLLYQSKGMLAILYQLFPNSPYLLKSAFEPIKEKYVKKRMFGREGANIDIVEDGKVLRSTDGIYDEYKSLYQEYVDFVQDSEQNYYQAGVFYSDGACGIGFRRGKEILDDMSQFVGHIVKKTS